MLADIPRQHCPGGCCVKSRLIASWGKMLLQNEMPGKAAFSVRYEMALKRQLLHTYSCLLPHKTVVFDVDQICHIIFSCFKSDEQLLAPFQVCIHHLTLPSCGTRSHLASSPASHTPSQPEQVLKVQVNFNHVWQRD